MPTGYTTVLLLQARQHLRKISCGFEGKEGKVCCSSKTEGDFETVELPEVVPGKRVFEELMVEESYVEDATCGIKSSFSVLISGGEETAPGDWPWMALLRYSDPAM